MDDTFLIYDKPYDYKDIKIYPIVVENYLEFNSCINCLLLQKNKTPDVNIIKMAYLDWLFKISEQDTNNVIFVKMLVYLFSLIFKDQPFNFYQEGNKIIFTINEIKFNAKDFDEIKKIVCRQNSIDDSEIILDDELEKALKEAEEYKERNSVKFADLEELMVAYHIYTGCDYEKLYQMPIRKFNKGLERIQMLEDYRICKSAELSGMVKFKEEIKYWLIHIEPKGKFDNLIIKDANKKIGDLKQMLK